VTTVSLVTMKLAIGLPGLEIWIPLFSVERDYLQFPAWHYFAFRYFENTAFFVFSTLCWRRLAWWRSTSQSHSCCWTSDVARKPRIRRF